MLAFATTCPCGAYSSIVLRVAIAIGLLLAAVIGALVAGYRLHGAGSKSVSASPVRLIVRQVPGGAVGEISCQGPASRARTSAMLRELAKAIHRHPGGYVQRVRHGSHSCP